MGETLEDSDNQKTLLCHSYNQTSGTRVEILNVTEDIQVVVT